MKNKTQPHSTMRYHLLGNDGLYAPIPFLFVTDRMREEINAERQKILESLPAARHERQLKLFEPYNPDHSSTAFNAMLHLFNPRGK